MVDSLRGKMMLGKVQNGGHLVERIGERGRPTSKPTFVGEKKNKTNYALCNKTLSVDSGI